MINKDDLWEIQMRQIEIDSELLQAENLILLNEAETMLLKKKIRRLEKESKRLDIIKQL